MTSGGRQRNSVTSFDNMTSSPPQKLPAASCEKAKKSKDIDIRDENANENRVNEARQPW